MKVLYTILCMAILGSVTLGDEPDIKFHQQCLYPTVRIGSMLGSAYGSGVIVRSEAHKGQFINIVITATHVAVSAVREGPMIVSVPIYEDWSQHKGYNNFPATPLAGSVEHDLSILTFTSAQKMPVAELDLQSKVYIGTKVFKIGYGVGDDGRVDYGEITAANFNIPGHSNVYRVNATTAFGDSGGPLFLKESYKVKGITRAIRTQNGKELYSHVIVTPLTILQDWNKELGNKLQFIFDHKTPIPAEGVVEKAAATSNINKQLIQLNLKISGLELEKKNLIEALEKYK